MSKWLGGQNSNGGFVAFFLYIPVMPYVSQEVLNYLESCLLLRHKATVMKNKASFDLLKV